MICTIIHLLKIMDIYNVIDLRYRVVDGNLKYDYILYLGADPKVINFNYEPEFYYYLAAKSKKMQG